MTTQPTEMTSDDLSSLAVDLDPQDRERKKAQRVYRLNVIQIPLLRLFGFGLILLGVLFHDLFLTHSSLWPSFVYLTLVVIAYALLSWLLLYLLYTRVQLFDVGIFFLVVDVFVWTVAVYFSGGEKSWFFFILMMRVADQVNTSFKRALAFAHLPVLSYGLMILYISWIEQREISWPAEVTKMLYIYGANLYISLAARPAEQRRNKIAAAMRLARELILQLTEKSQQVEETKRRLERLDHQNDMILQAAGEGICGIDLRGNTIFANPAAARLTGWEVEELVDKPHHVFLHYRKRDGSFYPWAECPIYVTLQRGAIHYVDGEVFWRKDGTSFLVEYTSSPIRERGEIVGAVLVFRDVSERRRTEEAQLRATAAEAANQRLEKEIVERQRVEEALRESEERWQLALRGNNDGIWDWNVKTCEMVFSPRCKEMCGFHEHEIANYITAWAQLVHPDDIEWVTQAIQDHFAKKTPFYITEHRVRCKDGSYKWILDRGQALWDDTGNVIRMVGSHTDITERKRAEEALLRLSNAVQMSTDSIVITDLEGKIVELNEATLRMYGTTNKEDLLGKSAFAVIAPEDGEEALAAMEEVLEKEAISNRECTVIVKDGSTLPVEMSVALMKDARGNPVGFVGISRDITERRETELALRQAKEAAETANRAKSEFLATMSHELRTPLSVILGYSDLMAEGEFGSVSDKQSETLERIRRNALELNELIASVLDLSRIEAGRLPVDVKEVQVPTVLEELKAETQEAYQHSRLHFGWEGEAGLAPIRTDPEKLKVVLRNLIGNAVKFTPQGSITVKASPKRGGVEVSVTDTGVGIPPGAVAVIFEPFRQVDGSATRQYGGAGLGLHIVKRLLELLGGNVAVESEVGRGSTFRVWLPSDRRVQPRYMGFH